MALGLFHCQVCKVMRRGDAEVCKTLTTTEGIMLMNKEVSFLANRECYSLFGIMVFGLVQYLLLIM